MDAEYKMKQHIHLQYYKNQMGKVWGFNGQDPGVHTGQLPALPLRECQLEKQISARTSLSLPELMIMGWRAV